MVEERVHKKLVRLVKKVFLMVENCLIKSTLSSLSIFHVSLLVLPLKVILMIEKI